jgi:hypothetical protein
MPGTTACGRYVWTHFDLDDALSVTIDGGGAMMRGRVLDFTVNYDVLSPPVAENEGPICAGQTLNLTASAISGAAYAWTGPNGFTSSEQNPSIPIATPAASGTYSVTATVGACVSSADTTEAEVCLPPLGDGLAGTTAATFKKNGTIPNQIDVTFDPVHCPSDNAVILYGNLSNIASGYKGFVQCSGGKTGSTSFTTTLADVWFNIVWQSGIAAGHPGFGFNGTGEVERTWNAAGNCGIAVDGHCCDACSWAIAKRR